MSIISNLFYKMDKIPLIIILIKSDIDNINYNLVNLLNNNNIIESTYGINTNFINKTKTIMTKSEYLKDLFNNNKNYISNIDSISIIHNKILYNKINNFKELNNICEDTTAILVDEDNCWIEISDKGFFVPDGWMGVTTKDIVLDIPSQEVITLDGVRVEYADGFGLARASNTTPVLVLRFEGQTTAALQRIEADMMALLRRVKPDAKVQEAAH